jgi:hypothetical protein
VKQSLTFIIKKNKIKMSTGRDLVSRVRSLNKLISSDNNITDRMIYKELKAAATLLIKRETNLRRLWNSPNIFTPLRCLQMEAVPLSECCDYKSPCMVARSVKKIPQISEGIFGLLIQSVFSPGMQKYDYATVDRFVNILKMKLKNTKKYYWVYDDRIYISDERVEAIDVLAFFDDDFNESEYSMCQHKDTADDACLGPLDKEFTIPSYLEKQLLDLVNETLSKTYFRHIVDPQTNFKDEEKS